MPNCLIGEALPFSEGAAPFVAINRIPQFVVLN
jgi:hypothetical protein